MFVRSTLHSPWTCSPALVIRVDMQSCACHSIKKGTLSFLTVALVSVVLTPPPPSSSYPFLPLSSPSALHPLLGPTLPNIVFSELPTTLICASLLVYLMRSLLVRLCQHANHEWLYAQIRMLVFCFFCFLFFCFSLCLFLFLSVY